MFKKADFKNGYGIEIKNGGFHTPTFWRILERTPGEVGTRQLANTD
jgi:hypothetical protein